ncbi:unnamed protein product [Caenorhabditis brenneri]
MEGFKHGANCHDFEPIDGTVPGSFYTYQIYGQTIIQVTRYVVGKRSYVAGFCIYNEFTECSGNDDRKVQGVDINTNVIKKLIESSKYPGREALKHKVKETYEQPRVAPAPATTQRFPSCQNVRYCRELKRGMMTDDESDAVYHQEWDPVSKSVKTWKCNGCSGNVDDGVPPSYSSLSMIIGHVCVYISRRLQSKRSKGITRTPIKPFNEKQLILYTGSEYSENKTPEAKILLSHPVCYANWGYAKLNKILKMVFGLEDCEENLVPPFMKIISIKMEGFKHGANCHDFEPIDGSLPGSFYTYEVFGENIIQVTRYVVGEQSYVAGFCIFNKHRYSDPKSGEIEDADISIDVIKNLMESPKYPGREALEHKIKEVDEQTIDAPDSAITQQDRLPCCRNIRYCRELKRGIMTDDESDAVYHQEWDPTTKSMKTWKCNVCTGIVVDSGEPPSYSSLSMV